jgi:hypothetical protein
MFQVSASDWHVSPVSAVHEKVQTAWTEAVPTAAANRALDRVEETIVEKPSRCAFHVPEVNGAAGEGGAQNLRLRRWQVTIYLILNMPGSE